MHLRLPSTAGKGSAENMDLTQIACVLFFICFVSIDCLMFHLPVNKKKCLREEIHKDVLVTGDYELSEAPGQKATLTVKRDNNCF